MTRDQVNTATVEAYVQAMNAGDIAALRPLFTADAEIQGVVGAGVFDFAARVWHDLHHGLNMKLDVLSLVANGDTVVVRLRESGKWTGPFLDFKQPTGRSYELLAIEWFELTDGKIARRWGARDGGSQARQLGFPGSASHCPATREERSESA
ncbi:ester cyclase [Ensifer adhaerens]|uniref:ester cyclase n=1 Tax=Ensifer adhaerens TaxID=106592 RepID=UPI0023A929A9|nr:ester cyclase [Ensifer adhaerens]WDZ78432.1 ester cyclase [Ensifer adhaerens]